LGEAVRALILDPDDRVLLVRFDWPDKTVWALPGGGIDADEPPDRAIARELAEECGLRDFELGPCVWTRTHWFTDMPGWAGQTERVYLIRTEAFEPAPEWTAEQLAAEGVGAERWFTREELGEPGLLFAPRRLPALFGELLADVPEEPRDVGV
jgi:ADP-ribose pyrophosphatase YjhB (NUDIX family)